MVRDMAEVTDLNALQGSYINLTYTLPNGQTVRLLEDGKVYLGNQLHRQDTQAAGFNSATIFSTNNLRQSVEGLTDYQGGRRCPETHR